MDYDMADRGRYNPDWSRKSQERRTRHTAPSLRKRFQNTKKPPAETSVTSSTARHLIGWTRKLRSTTP
jgi:hypothetical protein